MIDWRKDYKVVLTEHSTPVGWISKMRVERIDGKDGITWDALQEIKNEVMGHEVLAVEFFPPADDMVDEGNYRHLWEIKPEWLPFGLGRMRRG